MIYQIHKALHLLLTEALQNKVFTSCEVGFFWRNKKKYEFYTYFMSTKKMSFSSNFYFDLASLTKVLVTVPCLFVLLTDKKIYQDDPLSKYFSKTYFWKNTRLSELINHTSGLPAHKLFIDLLSYCEHRRFHILEEQIFSITPDINAKGNILYSDLGYLLLGRIIEKVSGMKLDRFWYKTIAKSLKLKDLFYPSQKSNIENKYISTGKCSWSNNMLLGRVNDENCRILGGVCGHAGLFGNCMGVLILMEKLLKIYKGEFFQRHLSTSIIQKSLNSKTFTRRSGFDTPDTSNSSCGDYFSDFTIGHLGFTGTSVWMDMKSEAGVVFLTNRINCGSDTTAIRILRPKIHNAIMKNITHKENSL